MITNEATITDESGKSHDEPMGLYDRSREQALVAAAQAGMTDAMDQLLARHKTVLYRAARRFTRSREDAEDLVQETMLRAFVHVRKFRKECQFATWLIAIVNNAAVSMKRKAKNTHFESLDSKYEEVAGPSRWDVPDVRLNPEQEILRRELSTLFQSILLRQSRRHQIILQRCVFDETRIADVASTLGLTIASAKSSLFRARRRVSASLERRGLVKRRDVQNRAQ
jgi:RNA polymerase sigma-70 factor, ECF subfamily